MDFTALRKALGLDPGIAAPSQPNPDPGMLAPTNPVSLGGTPITAPQNLLDVLNSSNYPKVQSDVGAARSGYQSPYAGMSTPDLAALDRYSQGQIYSQSFPQGTLGYLRGLPGAVLGGVGAEVAKTQTGSALAQALAKRLGADPTQFQIDSTSSPPSLNNILWLLRGQAAGAFGDK